MPAFSCHNRRGSLQGDGFVPACFSSDNIDGALGKVQLFDDLFVRFALFRLDGEIHAHKLAINANAIGRGLGRNTDLPFRLSRVVSLDEIAQFHNAAKGGG